VDTDKLKELLNKLPLTLFLGAYLGYLGYEYYFFTTDPGSDLIQRSGEIQAAKDNNEKVRKKIKDAAAFYKSLDQKKKQIRSLAKDLSQMKSSLSEQLDIPAFIKSVVTEAKRVGLRVESFQPTKEKKEEFYFINLRWNILNN